MEADESGGTDRRKLAKQHEERPYEVGYGKPPKATHFGVRPQPQRRGRPKSAHFPRPSKLTRFLEQPIEVKLDRRTTKLHPHEATLHGLFARSVKGHASRPWQAEGQAWPPGTERLL